MRLYWFAIALSLISFSTSNASQERRIVSTSPQITEWLFQIGKGKDLVASTDFSFYPEVAKQLPSIGSLFLPSLERTLGFRPDLVLVDPKVANVSFIRALTSLKVPTQEVELDTVESLFTNAVTISQVFGETPDPRLSQSKHCIERFQSKLEFSFIILAWHAPPILFARSTFLSNLFTRVGGTNLSPEGVKASYPLVSAEWLVSHKPDLVFFFSESKKQNEEVEKAIHRYWPVAPKAVPLSYDYFARASFTPLKEIDSLNAFPKTRWKECFE